MDNQLLQKTYLGKDIVFTPEGWINATQTIKALEAKRLDAFMKSKYFKEYLEAYCEFYDVKPENVINVVKGGNLRATDPTKRVNDQGTYLHPDFVVLFARWINPKFAVWCDAVIKKILTGEIEIKYKKVQQELRQELDHLEEKHHKLYEELKLYQRPPEDNETLSID